LFIDSLVMRLAPCSSPFLQGSFSIPSAIYTVYGR
jgi:hypothetical protein